MARYIILLRAVNVGGTGKLKMKELGQTLEQAGYQNVQTLLASGNVVLDTEKTPTANLASTLEMLLTEQHELTTDVMVRTPEQWAAMIDANPISELAEASPSAFGVMVMKDRLDAGVAASIIESWTGPERIEVGIGCLYIHYTDGMGRSKLKVPKTVGVGTVRNWNTIRKLLELSGV